MLILEPSMVLVGDTIARMGELPERCVQCCVTSPPYWGLRDYGVDGQIGLEATPDEFVARMVEVFRAVRRVLRDDGTLWLNLGDSYARQGGDGPGGGNREMMHLEGVQTRICVPPSGLKPKDLCGIPWRVVLALQADGWYWRSVICWAKKSPMPESCTDRPTSAWEPIFLLAKSERYFYDAEAVKEPATDTGRENGCDGRYEEEGARPPGSPPRTLARKDYTSIGRNQRNVWTLGHEPYAEAHFATFPTEIPRRAIKAGTSEKGCCPACGAPWRRVTTRSKVTRERPADYVKRDGEEGTGNSCANSVAGVSVRTLGWEPSCECPPHTPVPCLVLDPFLGSGTTVAVARELGRWGVGCELNPAYAELARVRIGKAERPGTFRDMREVKPEDAPLFAGGARS